MTVDEIYARNWPSSDEEPTPFSPRNNAPSHRSLRPLFNFNDSVDTTTILTQGDDLSVLVEALTVIKQAVLNGELDAQMDAASCALRSGFKK